MAIKNLIKLFLPSRMLKELRRIRKKNEIRNWKNQGSPLPPPHSVKQAVIEEYQRTNGIKVFIETGTYLGDMVYAMQDRFQKIFSIELDIKLWESAKERFRNHNHITILQGDSGRVLLDLILKINEKALFWLDGHYSAGITAKGNKDCPIIEELTAILNSKSNHILLIDDARCFTGSGDYPTIAELSNFICSKKRNSKIEVKDDIIRVILD